MTARDGESPMRAGLVGTVSEEWDVLYILYLKVAEGMFLMPTRLHHFVVGRYCRYWLYCLCCLLYVFSVLSVLSVPSTLYCRSILSVLFILSVLSVLYCAISRCYLYHLYM